MRAKLAILAMLAGCGSDTNVVTDMVAVADMAVCSGGVSGPTTPTPCGLMTCSPGSICVVHVPGIGFPNDLATPIDGGSDDGGAPPSDPEGHTCVALAPDCANCAGCGGSQPSSGVAVGLPFGCFARICDQYEDKVGCRFDGANLSCLNL